MLKTKEAIILAGGLGTRLKGVISDIPKPMAPVANYPFLKYILDYLTKQGIERVVLSVGYKYEVIKDYFSDNYNNIKLVYSVEENPLGTGGGIRLAVDKLKGETVFIINGDTFFDVDLEAQELLALSSKSDLCLALKVMKGFDRYGSVELLENRIVNFKEKQFVEKGLINGGVYWLKKDLLNSFKSGEKFSFEQDVMEKELSNKVISGFVTDTYFIDIGIPEDYKQANIDFK
jgi:D-glycero-alpha-D-manno-heptose 1-phosphate guanylyltransferase